MHCGYCVVCIFWMMMNLRDVTLLSMFRKVILFRFILAMIIDTSFIDLSSYLLPFVFFSPQPLF